jgi:TRAP-type mannitol/chloroaromatic compound transport system permease small subunit
MVFVVMALMIVGIITRILGAPLSGITNLSESMLVVVIYLSIAYTQQTKDHVIVEFFIATLRGRKKVLLNIINVLIPFFICSIFIYTSWDYALDSWGMRERMDGAPFYPIYPPKIAIAVGISLLWLQLLADLLREVTTVFRNTDEGKPNNL